MMKISDMSALSRPLPAAHLGEAKSQPMQKNVFADIVSDLTRQNCNEKLTAMSSEIIRQGEILGQRKDIMEMKRYKRMLTEFMQEIVRFTYELNKHTGRDGRGRHKMYAIIKVINQKLDKMTQEILTEQADTLQLMADIEDINGMLLDLLA